MAIKLDNIMPSLQIAAEVSSQEDSMARMVVDNVCCFVSPLNPPKGEVGGGCYFDVCCYFNIFCSKSSRGLICSKC